MRVKKKKMHRPPWLITLLYGSIAFISTLWSWSPIWKSLHRRPSSRSSDAEYSWTVSTPFWSSSVVFGLGRSSEQESMITYKCINKKQLFRVNKTFKQFSSTYIKIFDFFFCSCSNYMQFDHLYLDSMLYSQINHQ